MTTPTDKPAEPIIRPPVGPSLLVPAVGLFVGALAILLAWASEPMDPRAACIGVVPAVAASLLAPAALLLIGARPLSSFSVAALLIAMLRMMAALGGLLAAIVALDPHRPSLLVGFLAVALTTLVTEKLVLLSALRPASPGGTGSTDHPLTNGPDRAPAAGHHA